MNEHAIGSVGVVKKQPTVEEDEESLELLPASMPEETEEACEWQPSNMTAQAIGDM